MGEDKTTVRVILEHREGGGLRVYSKELVGLILSGSDKRSVVRKIAPAIKALFKAAKGLDVIVYPARPLNEVLDGPTPRTIDMHVETKDYIVELKKAA